MPGSQSIINYLKSRHKMHQELYQLFEQALDKGPWDRTEFLRSIGSKLKICRDEFDQRLKLNSGYLFQYGTLLSGMKKQIERTGQFKVYISLYNSEGENLKKWYKIIHDLVGKVMTRPVYRIEEDVRSLIRTKPNPMNEGYLIVYITPDLLIQNTEDNLCDQEGRERIILKDGAVALDNIDGFVHSQQVYQLKFNRLVLKDEETE